MIKQLEERATLDLYDGKVQEGIGWTLRQVGEALGAKSWESGDGTETVEGDVWHELQNIMAAAGLVTPAGDMLTGSYLATLQAENAGLRGRYDEQALFLAEDAQAFKDLDLQIASLTEDRDRLAVALNTPELHDFAAGVVSEAQHQRERFGVDHDAGKEPADWFWLLGYLAGKALRAAVTDDTEKALHHCISSAAALANWHAALSGHSHFMRPGTHHDNAARSPLKITGEVSGLDGDVRDL